MIIKTNHRKRTLFKILNELSDKYLHDLSVLVDSHEYNSREDIIEKLVLNIKNPVKIKNYFYNLNGFQKKVISDILYNLDGIYIENYILAKYDKLPEFERKNILFTNNTYPSYFSLFVYQKNFIPFDLQEILKSFIPEPQIWEPFSIKKVKIKEVDLIKNKNTIFYTYLYSQLRILSINEKKFKLTEESKKVLNKFSEIKSLTSILKLMYYTELIEIKNRKIIPKYKDHLSINNLKIVLRDTLVSNSNLINSTYKKTTPQFIKDIIIFRNIIVSNIQKLKNNLFYELNEIYKFIEINNYKKLKKLSLTRKEKLDDIKYLLQSLSYLNTLTYFKDNSKFFIYLPKKIQEPLIANTEIIDFDLEKEIIILENFEIIIMNKLSVNNKLIIESFADKTNNKNYLINKNKLLKLLNKGLLLETLYCFIKNISINDLPASLKTYMKDLKDNKISINSKNLTLEANSLIIETLIHHKRFKEDIKKLENNKLTYNQDIEKKLTSYLIQLDYYVKIN